MLHTWGFALYMASTDSYREDILPSGLPTGSPEEALDCAGELYLNAFAPVIRVPASLVVLVRPPASGRTSFVRALIERRQIDAEAVVSSDEIRAQLFGTSPPGSGIGAYAAIMARDAGADRLRSESATAVHDVPGRREATTPAEAGAHFSFA
ncbi:hypothetical protein ACFYYQ_11650 [Streptomyces albidoflavus]